MSLLIGVPKETFTGEKRVATVPEVVAKLVKLGFSGPPTSSSAAPFFDAIQRVVWKKGGRPESRFPVRKL